jgi:RecA-family ATPase
VLAKDDRSKIIWQIGSALAAAGATPSETLAILKLTAFWRDRAVDGKSEDQERLIAKLFNAAPPPTPAIYANALVAQDPGDWADKPLPVRDFLIDKTFPMRKVTGLYGDGGLGKTTLALQLAIAVATGQPFLEMPTRQGKVFAVLAENEEMDSHISFDALCRSCSIELSDLRGRIKVASRAGLENILMSFPRGQPTLTPLFDELIRQVKAFAPILVIIDTAADVFGGNEISRPEVRAFIADCCGRIARESGAAVLLLLHPSKAGMESGRGDGGSTAWHNSMRGRWYLKPAEDGDVERRVLDLMKAQYGPPGTSLQLRWRDGAFEIDKGGSSRRNTPDETKIIAEVERAFRESEPWSAHHQSQTKWLGRWIITHLNKKRAGANALVNRLLSNGAVVSVEYDRHRHRQGLCTPLQAAEFRRAKQTRKSEATSPK